MSETAKVEGAINLKDRVTLKVTKKGAEMPNNKWVEGQPIKVHPITAEYFIKHGVAAKSGKSETKDA